MLGSSHPWLYVWFGGGRILASVKQVLIEAFPICVAIAKYVDLRGCQVEIACP